MKKLIISLIALCLLAGCRDDFAKTNQQPDKITNPDMSALFTGALLMMDVNDYMEWFYNHSMYYLPWTQATVAVGGNSSQMNVVGNYSQQENLFLIPKLQVEEIRYQLREIYSPQEAAGYEYLKAICNPVTVYAALFGTDSYGSLPYIEGAKAPFTSPPIITPAYQTQEQLFEAWLAELDETVRVLTTSAKSQQINPGAQDFVYHGDWSKWAKFANSLKLKIAVRMLDMNKPRALEIAKDVAESSAGVINAPEDDFIFAFGTDYFHFNNPVENLGTGSRGVVDFLVAHKDPRVRFLFAKNDFNSSVVQTFFDAGKEIPPYILALVDYTDVGGVKTFKGWKAPGEPWVRYHGAPVDIQARSNAAINNAYFNSERFKLTAGEKTKQYRPTSLYNEEMVWGKSVYTFPSAPDAQTIRDDAAHPWHGAFMSTTEVNLYLAELKLHGAALPETADSYFKRGVEMSVRLYDKLAALNKIPYYENHAGFDPHDATIALAESEIAPLLTAYALSGSSIRQLEQVYIQQYIHFIYSPNELFVTVRRSGFPAAASTILARETFDSSNPAYPIPRRLPVPVLSPTDQMYNIKKAAFAEQGFTPGISAPQVLHDQRIWYDKNAPGWGMGAK